MEPSPDRPVVVSYTIYHSPNAYLGIVAANRALAGLPVAHVRRPIYVPRARGVMIADLVGSKEPAARTRYHREDCLRWARRRGVPLQLIDPAEFDRRAQVWARAAYDREELPARLYYAAEAVGRGPALDRALFEAAWVHAQDVNDEAVLRRTIQSAGLDPDDLFHRAADDGPGRQVREALAAFDAAACPGVPTFVFDNQRFWGKDRIDDLVHEIRRTLPA
jgi:2-hydroxychromene-2-carboxylate isomerase